MSAEIDVVFHRDFPSNAVLTRMFEQLGFPLSFRRAREELGDTGESAN